MQLSRALRLRPGLTVAFVGAGGKTSAIRRLALEISNREIAPNSGDPPDAALITTTTRLGRGQESLANYHLVDPSQDQMASLPDLMKGHRSVLVTGPASEDKWLAPEEHIQDELHEHARNSGAVLLIEADGAQGRSLKAPAEHEPVIPKFTNLVVPMAGLDVLAQSVQSDAVHRPELVATLLDASQEIEIGPDELGTVVAAADGGLKGVPEGAEVRVLLNKAENSVVETGRRIAQALLENTRIQSVALVSALDDDPVWETHGRVAGVVLAAGGSSRLGEPKQLIRWRNHPLVWYAVRAAEALDPVAAVIGGAAVALRRELKHDQLNIIENADWEAGQSGSVRLGLEAVSPGVEGVVFLLADMPFVGSDLVGALIERHRQTLAPLVVARAAGRRANPVLFDRDTFSSLRALSGDRGGRAIFQQFDREFVDWDDSILLDVDTPKDLERLRELE